MQTPAQYILLFSGQYFHHSNVFIKIHVFFQLVLSRQLNNELEYLVQYLVPISYADNHKIQSILFRNCTVFLELTI